MTIVTLRRALSAATGVSEKVADDFLSAFFDCIHDGLLKDGNVSINGLGTFKLQEVPPRESMNVVTGERFTIKGYNKVVFSTDSAKSANKAEEPIDPIKKLGEQAEEIKDILSELNAMSTEEPTAAGEPLPVSPVLPEMPVQAETPKPEISEPKQQEPEQAESAPDEPKQKKPGEKKPFNPWLTGLITIVVFALLLLIAYFVLRHQIINWADGMRTTLEQRVNTPAERPAVSADFTAEEPVPSEPAEQAEITEQPQASVPTEEPEPAQASYYDDSQRRFTEFQATETVGQDSRLAWVAKKHYGEKALWVFIYEANRDQLRTPDRVMPGMQLRIPKLPAELRDVNNPQTAALLQRLSDTYLK